MLATISLFGKIPVSTFSLILAIGAGLGLFWSVWPIAIFPGYARARFDAGATALGGALAGGRFAYILANWRYFADHLVEIPQIWLGGLNWAGALAGGLLSVWILSIVKKTAFGRVADGLLPLMTGVVLSVWLACWLLGYAYGITVDAWWAFPSPDELGTNAFRWPTQLVGALSVLGVYWITEYLRARKRLRIPGMAACLALAGLSLTVFAISPFRADPIPHWRGIRADLWYSAGFFTLSAVLALYSYLQSRFTSPKTVKSR